MHRQICKHSHVLQRGGYVGRCPRNGPQGMSACEQVFSLHSKMPACQFSRGTHGYQIEARQAGAMLLLRKAANEQPALAYTASVTCLDGAGICCRWREMCEIACA